MIEVICQTCRTKFEAYPSDLRKYCSRECYELRQKKRIKKTCEVCGKEFETRFCDIKKGWGRFCSLSCANSKENNPAWKGGKSFEPYCILFNEEFKERVREFWDRECGICKISEQENGEKLSVHHITYDKETCCNTTIPLFIPSCKKCHSKTNYNRNYWEENLTNYIMIWFNGECYNRRVDTKN